VIFVAAAGCAAIGVDAVTAATRPGREVSLVLMNRADALLPTGAGPWISHLPQSQVVHVRNGDVADYERVLRLIWRSSLCLVLSVGGARALAHIGAVQALEETDVPTDAVAGAGMGALIGALVVKNVKAMDIRERMRRPTPTIFRDRGEPARGDGVASATRVGAHFPWALKNPVSAGATSCR